MRRRVTAAVQSKRLPRPNTLPCSRCGNVWSSAGPRHEYHHHKGYAPENCLDVVVVCQTCHTALERLGHSFPRGDARDAQIVPRVPVLPTPLVPPEDKVLRVMQQFFARQSPYTIEGYKQDLMRFAEFLGADIGTGPEKQEETRSALARKLFAMKAVDANYTVMQFISHMQQQDMAPATINRRLAALRSLVRLGNILGAVNWTIGVRGVKSKSMRDMRGPTVEQVKQMMQAAQEQKDPARAARDAAMLALFFTMGLRGVEVRELRVEDVDWDLGRVFVRGKGQTEREPLTLPEYVHDALDGWLQLRGSLPGPLFVSLSPRKSTAKGLSRSSVWKIVSSLGEAVGIKAWPHGLRHAAVTESLEMLNGDVRAVQKLSRHKNIQTVMKYDDQRRDVGGDIASQLADRLEGK